jgi:hypothetical protein
MLEEQDDDDVDVDKGGFSFLPIVLDWRMQSLQDHCTVSRRHAMIEKKNSKTRRLPRLCVPVCGVEA